MKIKQLLRPSYGWYNSVSKKDKWFLDDVQIPMYVAWFSRTACAKCGRCDATTGYLCDRASTQ